MSWKDIFFRHSVVDSSSGWVDESWISFSTRSNSALQRPLAHSRTIFGSESILLGRAMHTVRYPAVLETVFSTRKNVLGLTLCPGWDREAQSGSSGAASVPRHVSEACWNGLKPSEGFWYQEVVWKIKERNLVLPVIWWLFTSKPAL